MQKRKTLFTATALAAAAVATPALADDWADGWYGDIGGSYAILHDSDIEDGRIPGGRGELSFDDGYGVTGAVGYAFGNGLRAEIELGYRENDFDSIAGGAFGTAAGGSVSGDISAFSGMANVFYDYELQSDFTPYIGGGIGVADVSVDSTTFGVDNSDTVAAYQFMSGVRYPLMERVSLRVGYRFFTTQDFDIAGTEGEYISHNIETGLSFSF